MLVSKEPRKAIYTRSRLRNEFLKKPDEINRKLYKQQQSKCVSVQRKSIRHYFSSITCKGIITNKNIWKAIKPFLTNKVCLENSGIMLTDDEKMVSDEKNLCRFLTTITLTLLNGPVALNLKRWNLLLDQATKKES